MKIGIIGPAGSGKTALFNALTGQSAQTGGSARKNHLAAIKVPDPRLDKLQEITGRKNKVNAEIIFSDVAGGFTKPTREKGLDSEVAGLMKPFEALAIVVADFPEYFLAHEGSAEALANAREMASDLLLADLVAVEAKFDRMKREPVGDIERKALEKCRDALENERPLRMVDFNEAEGQAIHGYAFLSIKPALIVRNIAEDKVGKGSDCGLESYAGENGFRTVDISAKIEMELAQMNASERDEFLEELGFNEPAIDRFVRASYDACSLISFFTCGAGPVDEARAWTIRKGISAAQAAGKIHSDIQRGFIRAETIGYEEFLKLGSYEAARAAGKMRLEGKDYIVQDGDIMDFRFNV